MSKVSRALQAAGYSHLESLTEEKKKEEWVLCTHSTGTEDSPGIPHDSPGALGQLTKSGDLVHAGFGIHVHVADPFAVAHHWDPLGSFLDVSDQLGGASRDDQVNYFVQAAEILHFFPGVYLKRERIERKTASSGQTAETGLKVSLGAMLCISDRDVVGPGELSHRREGSGTVNHMGWRS